MENKQYFFCYDKKVMKELRYRYKMEFITEAIHKKTKRTFYLFEITNELTKALAEINDRQSKTA